jgi:hypothetical protein
VQYDANNLCGMGHKTIFSGSNGTASQTGVTTLSGGHYRLTSMIQQYPQGDAWQDRDLASDSYHLKGLASPQLTGSGCCCAYLPSVQF